MDKGKQIVQNKYEEGLKNALTFWKNKNIVEKFDDIMDIEQQFEQFRSEGLKKLKGDQLYKMNPFSKEKLFKHACERKESCTKEEQQLSFTVLEETSKMEIL